MHPFQKKKEYLINLFSFKTWSRGLYLEIIKELGQRERKLLAREQKLKREEGGLISSSAERRNKGKKKGARRQFRQQERRPVKQVTEKERETERKSIALCKSVVSKSLDVFVRRILALVTSEEWRWMDEFVDLRAETEKEKDSEEKKKKDRIKRDLTRRANEANQIMTVLELCANSHPDLALFIFENSFLQFAEGQSLEEAGT